MPIVVVAALIEREGKYLLSRRRADKHFGGYWEFPGGKLEDGESPEQALERELMEELGIRASAVKIIDAARHVSDEADVLILFYRCEWLSGTARPLESDRIEWVKAADLSNYRFPPADERLIRQLSKNTV